MSEFESNLLRYFMFYNILVERNLCLVISMPKSYTLVAKNIQDDFVKVP